MKRGVLVFLLLAIISIISSIDIHAFGVSTPYIKDETLLVNPGKLYEYTITLQNNGEEGNYVDITYMSTENIANLEETVYYVPADTYNTTFSFKLSIPENATIGKTYMLEYAARPRVNGSGTVSMGVEIKRGITVLVTDGTTNAIVQKNDAAIEGSSITSGGFDFWKIGKYILLIVILAVIILTVKMLWRLSKSMSTKINSESVTPIKSVPEQEQKPRNKYTISEAVSLEEVKKLLKNINDEAFEVSEIKNLFKEKLSELTTSEFVHNIHKMSRKELIRAIDQVQK